MDKVASELDGRLKVVEQELADDECRLGRQYDALETGQLSLGDLSPRIRSLRRRQDQLSASMGDLTTKLEQRRVRLPDTEEIKHYVNDLRSFLKAGNLSERRTFIKDFVKEIAVKRERPPSPTLCRCRQQAPTVSGLRFSLLYSLATPTGFEPAISALTGQYV